VVLTLVPTIASAQAGDRPAGSTADHPVLGSGHDGRPTTFESARYADHQMTVRLEVATAEAKLRSALALRAPRAAPPVIVATHAATAATGSTAAYAGPLHADWYAIAQCESSGNWSINTGNGFWGGLQFTPSTWFAYGGGPFDGVGPFPYSASQQIAVAERVLASQGPGAWPYCFRSG
jgi:hypothetical protein